MMDNFMYLGSVISIDGDAVNNVKGMQDCQGLQSFWMPERSYIPQLCSSSDNQEGCIQGSSTSSSRVWGRDLDIEVRTCKVSKFIPQLLHKNHPCVSKYQ